MGIRVFGLAPTSATKFRKFMNLKRACDDAGAGYPRELVEFLADIEATGGIPAVESRPISGYPEFSGYEAEMLVVYEQRVEKGGRCFYITAQDIPRDVTRVVIHEDPEVPVICGEATGTGEVE